MPTSCCSSSCGRRAYPHQINTERRETFPEAGVKLCAVRRICALFRYFFVHHTLRGITMKKTLLSVSLATLLSGLASSSAMALEQRPVLSLDVAKKMAAACESKAKQENWKMNIAIV